MVSAVQLFNRFNGLNCVDKQNQQGQSSNSNPFMLLYDLKVKKGKCINLNLPLTFEQQNSQERVGAGVSARFNILLTLSRRGIDI